MTAGATALLLAVLLCFLVVPIALAVAQGFSVEGRFSLDWLRRAAANETIRLELANGVALAACATLGSLVLALPLALVRARRSFAGQGLLSLAVLAPLMLPPFVGALSMRRLLGQYGVLNLILDRIGLIEIFGQSRPTDWLESGFWGTALLQSLHLFPILYLNISAALANLDPSYAQAARNLGAGPVRTFLRVTLPLIRPGIFAGATVVFIWSFTDIGTPLMLGYDAVAPVRLFKELAGADLSPRTFSLVFIMLASAVAMYVAGKFVFGRSAAAESAKAASAYQPKRLGPAGTAGAWLLFGAITAMALVPHAGVVLEALSAAWGVSILPERFTLDHILYVFRSGQTYRSILNSLRYAGAATAIDLVLGAAAAWLIVRKKASGSTLLDGLAMLPLAVPGLILAAGYIALTAPGTPLESIGPTRNPLVIIVIAYSIRRLPLTVRSISAGLEQVPVLLEEAARNLGASRLGAAARITLPLVAANVLAAGVLAFAFAVLEVSDSLILAQISRDYPVTKQIYILATGGGRDAVSQASAMGVFGMALLGGTMALAGALMGKKLGAIFRA